MNKIIHLSVATKDTPTFMDVVQCATAPDITFIIDDYTPQSGSTSRIFIKKSNSEVYNSCKLSGNVVTYTPTEASFDEVGRCVAQLQIVEPNDTIISFRLFVTVERNLFIDSTVTGSSEYKALMDMSEQMNLNTVRLNNLIKNAALNGYSVRTFKYTVKKADWEKYGVTDKAWQWVYIVHIDDLPEGAFIINDVVGYKDDLQGYKYLDDGIIENCWWRTWTGTKELNGSFYFRKIRYTRDEMPDFDSDVWTSLAQNTPDCEINLYVAIPSSESNAELLDLRVGYDTITYDTAGEAVRSQISNLSEITNNMFHTRSIDKNGALIIFDKGILTINTYGAGLTSGTYLLDFMGDTNGERWYLLQPGTYHFKKEYLSDSRSWPRFLYNTTADSSTATAIRENDVVLTFDQPTYLFFYLGPTGSVYNNTKIKIYVSKVDDETDYLLPHMIARDDLSRARLDVLEKSLPSATKLWNLNLDKATFIENGTDYDTLTETGMYYCSSAARAKSMFNCPSETAHTLVVQRLNQANVGDRLLQIIINAETATKIYLRYYYETGFGNWNQIGYSNMPTNTAYSRKLSDNVNKLRTECITTYNTLPMNNGQVGVKTFYPIDARIPGIIYSSVWRDGLDVYRNLTLETFYSAMANPASVLYTKDYTNMNIYNAHAWYGGVCSTFVGYICGIRGYNTTARLSSILEDKDIETLDELEVGDLLIMPGHIVLISQVYVDGNGTFAGVDISEQTRSGDAVFITTFRNPTSLQRYITTHNCTVKKNPNPGKIKSLSDVTFNQNIIFERGNNTYITMEDIEDGAWFRITGVQTIYYKKDDGTFNSLSLSSVDTKVVNGQSVYNLARCFTGPGTYSFIDTTSSTDPKYCVIKVIDFGNVELSGNTLRLSNWENCKPYNYYMVKEMQRTSETDSYAMKPSTGYYCDYTNDFGEIDVDDDASSITITIPDSYTANLNRYKVWVEYETGVGLAQTFSNLIIK